MVADMVAFVASQFTTSTWDVGAQELCSVVLINGMCMECYGKSEVGTGDRPFLFDLFSLLSGYFCFVGFSLSSLSFFS